MNTILTKSTLYRLFSTEPKQTGISKTVLNSDRKGVWNPQYLTKSISLQSLSTYETTPDYMNQSKIGLVNHAPELCKEGTGGTYFLKNNSKSIVAVFKPENEDPLSKQNPKYDANKGQFHFQGIKAGEGAQREVLAHQLDNNFVGVPETHMVTVSHWIFTDKQGNPGTSSTCNIKTKKGSLQKFVQDVKCTVDDVGYGKFSIEDVQKIAIFDMLLLNCDRNGGNILVQNDSFALVPIDHAFSLPDYNHLSDIRWFEWLTWRQVKQETISSVKSFIDKFDIEDAVQKAQNLKIRSECILSLRLSHAFLKKCISVEKYSLYEIGKFMCHRGDKTSFFEDLVTQASSSTQDHKIILSNFSKLLEEQF